MVQATKSKKRAGASKTRKAFRSEKRATLSVNDIRNRFKEMDDNVRHALKNGLSTPASLGKHVSRNWEKLFKKPLSSKAAASLAQHYLNLHGKKKGGSLVGAPLDHVMRPGLPAVATYATFPTEVGSDPAAVKDLDVYYNNALGRSCGLENTSAKPWAGIGSNLVPLPSSGPLSGTHQHTPQAAPAPAPVALPPAKGGRRKVGETARKSNCAGGGFVASYSPNQKIIKGGRRSTKRSNRKSGGDFMTALSTRQYVATNPAGISQRSAEIYTGQPVFPHDNAEPSVSAWTGRPMPFIPKPMQHTPLHAEMPLTSHPQMRGSLGMP